MPDARRFRRGGAGSTAVPAAVAVKPRRKKAPVIIGTVAAVVAVVLVAAFVVAPALHKNPFEGAKVGDVVQFGSYEQDGDASNGKEPIDWRVLAVDGNRAYLVSEKALTARAFNADDSKGNDWDSSDLKSWLAGDFASEAFSDKDREYVDGDPTLLSVDEANLYFQSDDDRACWSTQQAVNDGAFTLSSGAPGPCYWWLRSPGDYSVFAAFVDYPGDVISSGNGVVLNYAVRPALWVKL